MLLEEEYRRRMHEVNTEVKKRLDYHVSSDTESCIHQVLSREYNLRKKLVHNYVPLFVWLAILWLM